MLYSESMYLSSTEARIVVEGLLLDRFYLPPREGEVFKRLNMPAIIDRLTDVELFIRDCNNGNAQTYLSSVVKLGSKRSAEYPVITIIAEKRFESAMWDEHWENFVIQAASRTVNTLAARLDERLAIIHLKNKSLYIANSPQYNDSLSFIGI